jgi:AcrR family transcriptional regulator
MTVMKTAQPQGQARRDQLRAQVLAVVERHLQDGATYAELNVAGVASEAGISRSTFYAYFVDKPTLLRTWYAESTERILDAARAWWALDSTVTRTQIHAALERIVEAYRQHPELMAATHEAIGIDHGVREVVDSAMDRYVEGLRIHIETGQAEWFIDPTLPAEETAYWLQWMAERVLHRIGRDNPAIDHDRLIEAYTAIVWNTLYAPVR